MESINPLTEGELRILDIFRKDPFASPTIRGLMKLIETGSYSWTYNAVKKLEKQNILTLEKKGQSQLCRINLAEQKAVIYLALLEELTAQSRNIPNLDEIRTLIPPTFTILIIAGSYADGTFTDESDLDVVVIIENQKERKWLLNPLINKGNLLIPQLHPYVFTKDEFIEMLANREENYGKEIEKKHLIVSGAEAYFRMLSEAVRDGYRRKPVYGEGRK